MLNRGIYTRVGVCNLNEEYLYEFGSLGDGEGQFRLPSAIALDSRGRVYVADEYHSHVNVFEPSGEFTGRWGVPGDAEGEMDGPSGLVFDGDDRLFVTDQNNNRVSVFTSNGSHILSWESPETGWTARQSLGHHPRLRGRRVRGRLAQRPGPEVHRGGPASGDLRRPGDGDGEMHRPSSVAVDSDGYVYIADWGNERVQVLAPDGGFLLKLRGQATESVWAREFLAANPTRRWRGTGPTSTRACPHTSTPRTWYRRRPSRTSGALP